MTRQEVSGTIKFTVAASVATTLMFGGTHTLPMRVDYNKNVDSASNDLRWGGANVNTSLATPSSQDYYWTPMWQKEEKVALAQFEQGDFQEFDNVDDLLAWLDEPEA